MDYVTISITGLGLAMDAFAVSVASGCTIKQLHIKHALRIGLYFGLFQAFMPAIGWLAGTTLAAILEPAAPWIAFGLLLAIGIKMIYEALIIKDEDKKSDPLKTYVLLMLAIATSIDALAVGLSLAMLQVAIIAPVIIIGGITFALSFAGVYIGDRIGHFFESRLEILGGLILIGIGLRILLGHLL